MTYSVKDFGDMVRESPRLTAYAAALRDAITPGCTVLDIGAGFGFFSILACKFGAGRVIAVEPLEAITLGPELAKANGCADRITFVQGLSSDLGEDSRAEVIIADLRGALPLYKQHIPVIADARSRLLAPGGTLITQRDTLRCALLCDDARAERTFQPWDSNGFDLDLSAGRRLAVNAVQRMVASPDALLSAPVDLAAIDYRSATDPNVTGAANLAANRTATAHGIVMWFDAELAGGHHYSNAPGEPPLVYGHSFFPFDRPVDMAEGDRVAIAVDFRFRGNDYTISWRSKFTRAGQPDLRFAQSTAMAEFVTPDALRRQSGEHVPQPSESVDLDRHCLSRFDGATPLKTIADELMQQAPQRFASQADALSYAAAVANRYHEPG